jgi:hypothetical protein
VKNIGDEAPRSRSSTDDDRGRSGCRPRGGGRQP